MHLQKDLREFIVSLNSNGVEYLIVGGFALAFHGYPRYTGDIDIFIRTTPENARKLERVIYEFGFATTGLSAKDFLGVNQVVQLGQPPNRIDILTSLTGVDFEEAWLGRAISGIDGIPVFIIGWEAFLKNKRATGRAQDKADLEALGAERDEA
jgi:predicted nucleotidyltransferase